MVDLLQAVKQEAEEELVASEEVLHPLRRQVDWV